MQKTRNVYIDIVKAVAIILVVFGHCIQYGSGSEFLSSTAFFENKVFIFIYSFHMPLFMLVSGYLFAYSLKDINSTDGLKRTIIKKVKQLIIPLFSWSFVSLALAIAKLVINGNTATVSIIWLLKTLVSGFINGPWFLWAIWWCSLTVIVVRYFFKDSPYIYLAGLILTFIIPDAFGLAKYKFMYLYFVSSYFFNAYDFEAKLKKIYLNKFFIAGVIVAFIVMLRFYNHDTYIYTTGYTLLGKDVFSQLWNDCFRFIIGIFGGISVMYVVWGIYKLAKGKYPTFLFYIGKNTLGVYLISGILIYEGLARITAGVPKINYLLTFGESIVIMVVSLAINWILRRNKTLNTLFLGGR